MASAISAGHAMINPSTNVLCRLTFQGSQSSTFHLTSYPVIFSAQAPVLKEKAKRQPGRYCKIFKPQKKSQVVPDDKGVQPQPVGGSQKKRKPEDDMAGASKASRSNASKMVPYEGPSNV